MLLELEIQGVDCLSNGLILLDMQILEVVMFKGILNGYPLTGVEDQQFLQ